MDGIIDDWLKQARDEIGMAQYLLSGDYYREKQKKAMLLKAGWRLEKIHSITRLQALAHEYKVPSQLSDDDVAFLDSIYRGRYPAEQGLLPMGDPCKADAERACAIGAKVAR